MPAPARAVEATGHHGGCAEVGGLCDLESQGAPLEGAQSAGVKVAGYKHGYDYAQHCQAFQPCGACRRLFQYINGGG